VSRANAFRPGSARVPRVGFGVSPKRTWSDELPSMKRGLPASNGGPPPDFRLLAETNCSREETLNRDNEANKGLALRT